MIASNSSRWLSRNASATVPTSLCVLMSALRSGRKLAMPAASWPRFCMSSSIRGTSRATLLTSPAIGRQRGDRTARGVVDGRHAALMVKLTHVFGPPCGVSPVARPRDRESRPRRPRVEFP